jgi:hypothetical protein
VKKIIFVIVVAAAGYWGWMLFGPQKATNWVYAEFRVKYKDGTELVGIGRMDSPSDCERRAEEFWRKALAVDAMGAQVSPMRCGEQLPPRYEGLFSNRVIQATYVALDRGNAGERDGRFIIYGVPSSEVGKVCPIIINNIKSTYGGKVECVIGTIG